MTILYKLEFILFLLRIAQLAQNSYLYQLSDKLLQNKNITVDKTSFKLILEMDDNIKELCKQIKSFKKIYEVDVFRKDTDQNIVKYILDLLNNTKLDNYNSQLENAKYIFNQKFFPSNFFVICKKLSINLWFSRRGERFKKFLEDVNILHNKIVDLRILLIDNLMEMHNILLLLKQHKNNYKKRQYLRKKKEIIKNWNLYIKFLRDISILVEENKTKSENFLKEWENLDLKRKYILACISDHPSVEKYTETFIVGKLEEYLDIIFYSKDKYNLEDKSSKKLLNIKIMREQLIESFNYVFYYTFLGNFLERLIKYLDSLFSSKEKIPYMYLRTSFIDELLQRQKFFKIAYGICEGIDNNEVFLNHFRIFFLLAKKNPQETYMLLKNTLLALEKNIHSNILILSGIIADNSQLSQRTSKEYIEHFFMNKFDVDIFTKADLRKYSICSFFIMVPHISEYYALIELIDFFFIDTFMACVPLKGSKYLKVPAIVGKKISLCKKIFLLKNRISKIEKFMDYNRFIGSD